MWFRQDPFFSARPAFKARTFPISVTLRWSSTFLDYSSVPLLYKARRESTPAGTFERVMFPRMSWRCRGKGAVVRFPTMQDLRLCGTYASCTASFGFAGQGQAPQANDGMACAKDARLPVGRVSGSLARWLQMKSRGSLLIRLLVMVRRWIHEEQRGHIICRPTVHRLFLPRHRPDFILRPAQTCQAYHQLVPPGVSGGFKVTGVSVSPGKRSVRMRQR